MTAGIDDSEADAEWRRELDEGVQHGADLASLGEAGLRLVDTAFSPTALIDMAETAPFVVTPS